MMVNSFKYLEAQIRYLARSCNIYINNVQVILAIVNFHGCMNAPGYV